MKDLEKMLIRRSKKGDRDAFEVLALNYMNKTYNIALGLVGNEEDAKDVVQETFIKVFRGIHKFKEKSKFSTWLYSITINTGKDLLRNKKHTLPIERIYSGEKEQADQSLQVQEQIEQMEEREIIFNALKQLKDDFKNVIILKDLNGFSYQEIGEVLNINIGTVKSRISRGRQQLRTILQEMDR